MIIRSFLTMLGNIAGPILSRTANLAGRAIRRGAEPTIRHGYRAGKYAAKKGLSAASNVGGAKMFGLGAHLPGKYEAWKFALPALGLATFGIGSAVYGLMNQPYSARTNSVSYIGRPGNRNPAGTTVPYQNIPMEFGAYKRSYLDYNASGSLAFAMHNMR